MKYRIRRKPKVFVASNRRFEVKIAKQFYALRLAPKTTKKCTERIKKQPRVRKKYVDYDELPAWIRRAEDRINKMSHEEFCNEMVKFGTEAKKAGGIVNLVFRDIY
jgi:DNA repair ATPase RecN